MNITSAQYVTGSSNTVIETTIDDKKFFVSVDPANRHYVAIQEWGAEGNTIEEADD